MEHCLYYCTEILDAALNCKKKKIIKYKMHQILPLKLYSQRSLEIVAKKIVFIASLRLFCEMILTVRVKSMMTHLCFTARTFCRQRPHECGLFFLETRLTS